MPMKKLKPTFCKPSLWRPAPDLGWRVWITLDQLPSKSAANAIVRAVRAMVKALK